MPEQSRLQKLMSGIELSRAKEIYDAEREGRLIIAPCKVGDTLYLADFDREISPFAKQEVQELKVCFFKISERNKVVTACETRGESWYYVYPLKFGETVFTTREAAESALKARAQS